MNEERNNLTLDDSEDAPLEERGGEEKETPQAEPQKDGLDEIKSLYPSRKKRNGTYYNKRPQDELDAMQRKKTLFMYGSTLLFAVSLFLQVEGRQRLADNAKLFALFTAYVLLELALIVFTVYIAFMGRTGQKIAPKIKEKYVQPGGLDRFTFRSYEWFNALHFALAAAEIAVSVYKIGPWGVVNILASAGSAALSLLSRNELYKANAGQLTYIPEDEAGAEKSAPKEKKKKKK